MASQAERQIFPPRSLARRFSGGQRPERAAARTSGTCIVAFGARRLDVELQWRRRSLPASPSRGLGRRHTGPCHSLAGAKGACEPQPSLVVLSGPAAPCAHAGPELPAFIRILATNGSAEHTLKNARGLWVGRLMGLRARAPAGACGGRIRPNKGHLRRSPLSGLHTHRRRVARPKNC